MAPKAMVRFISALIIVHVILKQCGPPAHPTLEGRLERSSHEFIKAVATQLQPKPRSRILTVRTVSLAVLLILAGDVELNPGPNCASCTGQLLPGTRCLARGVTNKPTVIALTASPTKSQLSANLASGWRYPQSSLDRSASKRLAAAPRS